MRAHQHQSLPLQISNSSPFHLRSYNFETRDGVQVDSSERHRMLQLLRISTHEDWCHLDHGRGRTATGQETRLAKTTTKESSRSSSSEVRVPS